MVNQTNEPQIIIFDSFIHSSEADDDQKNKKIKINTS